MVGEPLGADRTDLLGFNEFADLAHAKKRSKKEVKSQ
jgi:hypothetical protein